MNDLSYEEAAEMLRAQVVCAMRAGQTLCIDCGKLKMNFVEEFSRYMAILPWDQIMNFQPFREQDNHIQMVKQDEMYMIGGQNPG